MKCYRCGCLEHEEHADGSARAQREKCGKIYHLNVKAYKPSTLAKKRSSISGWSINWNWNEFQSDPKLAKPLARMRKKNAELCKEEQTNQMRTTEMNRKPVAIYTGASVGVCAACVCVW